MERHETVSPDQSLERTFTAPGGEWIATGPAAAPPRRAKSLRRTSDPFLCWFNRTRGEPSQASGPGNAVCACELQKGVIVNQVVERRLALWPNAQTRAEAAELLYVKGWELGRVLALYSDEVVSEDRGVLRGAARRAIWAHYSLLQEAVGEPDIDPRDFAEVERVIRTNGVEVARCRAGSQTLILNASCSNSAPVPKRGTQTPGFGHLRPTN